MLNITANNKAPPRANISLELPPVAGKVAAAPPIIKPPPIPPVIPL